MKPVDQTRFGIPHGNCMAARIASVLEVPLDQIHAPPAIEPYNVDWFEDYCVSLNSLGISLVHLHIGKNQWNVPDGLHCILGGVSPREHEGQIMYHSVVGRSRRDGNTCYFDIVHDPHPSRDGLKTIESVDFVVRL